MKTQIKLFFLNLAMILAITFTALMGEYGTPYAEDFSQGSDLSALGFLRPLHWEIDPVHGSMRSTSPGGRSALSEVYSPRFAADRTAGTVIAEWKANFLPPHPGPSRRENDRLWVSLADEEGRLLYSLLFLPRRRPDQRADFDVELSKTVEGRPIVLARARTRAITPTGRWLGFRLMFHPPVANGGDGNIAFYYDVGDGKGHIEHIGVADETHLRFSRLHFKYETGTGRDNCQVAIDDLAVRLVAAQDRPAETSAELLADPGFEDGLKGWHASPGWSSTDRVGHHGGTMAVECTAPGRAWLAQGWGGGKLSIAGRHYLASVWVKAEDDLEGSLCLRWKDAHGDWLSMDEYRVILPRTDEWRQVMVEGEAPLGATQAWLYIERDRGLLLLDDCSLVERHPPNLLENPGFEAGPAAWSASPAWSFVSGRANAGDPAARVSLAEGEEATLAQGRSLPLSSEGMEFIASGWFKSTAEAQVRLALGWVDEEGTILGEDSTALILGTDKWRQLSLLSTAPTGAAHLRLITKTEGAGEVLADGFRLEERVRPNLLHNPGFERDTAFWRAMGPWRVDEKTAASGARSLRLEIPSWGPACYIRQGCEFGREIEGLRFLCSARIKTDSVPGVTIKPCWQSRVGNWLVDEASTATLSGTNDWTELRVAYTAPPGAMGVGLVVMAEKGDSRGTFWVDDCAVEPLVTLTIGATPGERPYTMEFNARLDLPGSITAYEWDFDGEGTADSDRPAPIHLFPGPGAYRCRLLATGADGSTYWTERTVTVLPALAIEVSWSEEEGFRLHETTGSGADLTSITWDFGDGTSYTGPEKEIVHAYRDGGRYTVRVTACDSYGNTAATAIEIDAPPSVEAAPAVTMDADGLTVHFALNAFVHYGGSVQAARWDFGDGSYGEGTAVDHTYPPRPGVYIPCVEVMDSFGYSHRFVLQEVTIDFLLTLSLAEDQICSGLQSVTGQVICPGEVESIALLLDEEEMGVLAGSKSITHVWDTFLTANGEHFIEVRVVLAGGKEIIHQQIVRVENPVYRIRIEVIL